MSKKIKPALPIVAHHREREQVKQWHEYLDEAVMRKFNGVICATYPTAKGHATHVGMKDGGKMLPALNKRVTAFIAGFMACEETYQ